MKNQLNKKILKKNYTKNFELSEINPSMNITNNDLIKYSIIRNNHNNKVSQAISITLGKFNNDLSSTKDIQDKQNYNNEKKTIINVNQFYQSYYINTNNIDRNKEKKIKK